MKKHIAIDENDEVLVNRTYTITQKLYGNGKMYLNGVNAGFPLLELYGVLSLKRIEIIKMRQDGFKAGDIELLNRDHGAALLTKD